MAIKKKKRGPKESKALTIAAAITAGVAVASLAFISLEAALLATGFFAAIGFVASDVKRRRFWENGLSFRMKGLSDNITVLGQKMTGTRMDVLHIRQEIAAINRRVSAQTERMDEMAMMTPGRPAAVAKNVLETDRVAPPAPPRSRFAAPSSSPTATKPGQKPTPAANDAEFDDLSDTVVRELIGHAVRSRAIDIFVQPIMRLPQRKVRFFEMYARVRARPGLYLPARRYMKLAKENRLANEIDNMLLTECIKTIQSSAHIERAAPLFLNITDATLKNTIFMKSLVGFLAQNRHLAPRLVFELPQEEFKTLEYAPREILKGLGKLGCAVSIDHVKTIDFDAAELQKYPVRFIKISAETLLPYTQNDKGRADLQRKKRILESNGVSFIAEKIETEHDLLELLDFDISYGQGHLFGKPDLESAYRKRSAA